MSWTMRLIDADALPRHKQLEAMGNGKYEDVEVVYASDIDNAPTIDAVPVVRCKECKHWMKMDGKCFPNADVNDFCSSGERKDDE